MNEPASPGVPLAEAAVPERTPLPGTFQRLHTDWSEWEKARFSGLVEEFVRESSIHDAFLRRLIEPGSNAEPDRDWAFEWLVRSVEKLALEEDIPKGKPAEEIDCDGTDAESAIERAVDVLKELIVPIDPRIETYERHQMKLHRGIRNPKRRGVRNPEALEDGQKVGNTTVATSVFDEEFVDLEQRIRTFKLHLMRTNARLTFELYLKAAIRHIESPEVDWRADRKANTIFVAKFLIARFPILEDCFAKDGLELMPARLHTYILDLTTKKLDRKTVASAWNDLLTIIRAVLTERQNQSPACDS